MNASMIGKVTVRSKQPFIVYGSVRGLVSEHRRMEAAQDAAEKDRRDCAGLGGGSYSDVSVYGWTDTGWEPMPEPRDFV